MATISHEVVNGSHKSFRALSSGASHSERVMLRHYNNADDHATDFQKTCRKLKYTVYVLQGLEP
jgi:hypothetical protein